MNLVGDVGGTNTRLALVQPDSVRSGITLRDVEIFANDDHESLFDLIKLYLHGRAEVEHAAVCIAAPVVDDEVVMLNRAWRFNVQSMRRELGLRTLRVLNDFSALAMALPFLSQDQVIKLGGGTVRSRAAIGVLGPGTGLGVSGLIPNSGSWSVLHGEGGHATLAGGNREEAAILDRLRVRFPHVSAERILSGQGLAWLYDVMTDRPLGESPSQHPKTIAESNEDAARRTVDQFLAFLGSVAGNLALTLGALGGVYVAGGVAQKLQGRFRDSPFRTQFEAKGRYESYLAEIPTWLVTDEIAALTGLAAHLDGHI